MGVFSWFTDSRYGRPLYCRVTTMDADLDRIAIEPDWTGRQLFDTACRIIGLREIWFFGLQYTNKKNIPCWLQMDKKVLKQDVPRQEDGTLHFLFLVKFFPEDVEEELIQDSTRHLFFVQVRQSILSMDLYCSAEASVLLASYAVQAMHGDYQDNENTELQLDKLLPRSVIEQYDMSADMWDDRIRRWWGNNAGQSREDAEIEYLRVAQDLDMFGIQYYPICNKKETDLHLGIQPIGIGIYKGSNKIAPRPFFPWSEIRNISFKNKKFEMKTIDASTISFRAQDASINMSILDLCIGTHNLYLRRRQPDLLEVQQMKAQAREIRTRRQEEQQRLNREREMRITAEHERDASRLETSMVKEKLKNMQDKVMKAEEYAETMAARASEAEIENTRIKMNHAQLEEARMRMERKAREAEAFAQRLMQDVDRRPHFASQHALTSAEQAAWIPYGGGPSSVALNGNLSYHQLMLSSSSDGYPGSLELQHAQYMQGSPMVPGLHMPPVSMANGLPPMVPNGALLAPPPPPPAIVPVSNGAPPDPAIPSGQLTEYAALKNELEKSRLVSGKREMLVRTDYAEKARNFKDKLAKFRAEIDGMRRNDEPPGPLERAHAQNVANGLDKYSTLRMHRSQSDTSLESFSDERFPVKKSAAGSTKSRVQVFDGL